MTVAAALVGSEINQARNPVSVQNTEEIQYQLAFKAPFHTFKAAKLRAVYVANEPLSTSTTDMPSFADDGMVSRRTGFGLTQNDRPGPYDTRCIGVDVIVL
jgi:hypothetical protein